MADGEQEVKLSDLLNRVNSVDPLADSATKHVEPLFKDEAEYSAFTLGSLLSRCTMMKWISGLSLKDMRKPKSKEKN